MNVSHTLLNFENAQLHRETYIAILNSILKDRGAKRTFANMVGITPNYLSQILAPWSESTPSRDLAKRIVEVARLDATAKQDLLHHLRSANPRSIESRIGEEHIQERLSADQARDVMLYLDNYQYHSVYGSDASLVRASNLMLLKLGKWALARIDPKTSPYQYTEICGVLSGASNTLNQTVGAMWYARLGLATAQRTDLWPPEDREKYHMGSLINTLDAIAVSYHNLGLPLQAMDYIKQAKHEVTQHTTTIERMRWIPMVAMEELNTLMITPRMSITAAEAARDWGLNTLFRGTTSQSGRTILVSLIYRNMVECYIHHGSRRSLLQAQEYIEDHYHESFLKPLGALVHVMHLRTGANLSRKLRDVTSYRSWIDRALALSRHANLIHQTAEIEAEVEEGLGRPV